MTTELPQRAVHAGFRVGDRYELIEPVASGGMAQVWKGLDRVLNRRVAVKILHPHLSGDRGFLLRFRREAIAAARLSHPSVVSIYDTVSTDGLEAIVMEFIEGRTLREVMDERAALSLADVREIGTQVADALAAAHRSGVVHRDIKPSNILLCPDRRVMVTDFGIAKAGEDTDLTVAGTLLGTAKYLSPEQVRGDAADGRSDLYSLGVVLYEAIAGQPPFRGETDAATALVRLHEAPRPLHELRPETPDALAGLVHRLLQREPADRVQRAVDVRAALSGPVVDPTVVDRTTPVVTGSVPAVSAQPLPDAALPVDQPGTGQGAARGTDDARIVRSWLVPAFSVVLLGAGLVVAALLFSRSPLGLPGVGASRDAGSEITMPPDVDVAGTPVIAGVRSFDPQGDGSENENLVAGAFDGDDGTSWRSETYRSGNFGRLKAGVGLVVELAALSELTEIEVSTPTVDWSLEVYASPEPMGDSPESWGSRVGGAVYEGADEVTIELRPVDGGDGPVVGRFVMIWITDHGVSSGDDGRPLHRFELRDLTIA